MDNIVFNVNGKGFPLLELTMRIACIQREYEYKSGDPIKPRIAAWKFVPDVGLVLYWHYEDGKGTHKFPAPMTTEQAAHMVWAWLQTEGAWDMKFSGWDSDADHDGSNSKGWRVFVEDWGHVANDPYALFAVRPAWMWHGK